MRVGPSGSGDPYLISDKKKARRLIGGMATGEGKMRPASFDIANQTLWETVLILWAMSRVDLRYGLVIFITVLLQGRIARSVLKYSIHRR